MRKGCRVREITVDENGMAGDHPSDFEPIGATAHVAIQGSRRPQVLVVFLESFRSDLIGARLNGREVTPFLNRLARDGVSSAHAFVHTPGTAGSRGQFFGGRLISYPGQSPLIDDFKSLGYTVEHFSGQDDSYGGSESLMGVDRADVFYDARRDVDKRISRSPSPWPSGTGSTSVPSPCSKRSPSGKYAKSVITTCAKPSTVGAPGTHGP